MADISKLKLPNGNEYDLKVYTDHIAPMMTKTFTGVIGTANNFANATFYFGKIVPTDYNDIWKLSYREYVEIAGQTAGDGYYEVTWSGTASSIVTSINYNSQKNTSYRPLYNHVLYRAKQDGITGGYGHLLGERLYSSWNATTAANSRTFKIDILECINCTFTFFDTALKYANVPGTGSTNYDTYSEGNGTTQGITRTGTDANDVNYQNRLYYSASNAMLSYAAGGRYTLSFSKNDHYILPITSTDNVTNGEAHIYTTESFNPFGEIYYRNSSSAIAANAAVANATLYRQVLVDARYSFTGVLNGASSVMSAGKPVYIVCTPQLDGSAKLHTNPLGFVLPSTEDGLMYILLGYAYNTYQFELLIHHPVYMYKNGGVREVSGYAPYSGDAATVSGHTVGIDVPSNAVFTDTTYQLATTTTNGLMSSVDKIKLLRLDDIYGVYNSTTETIEFGFGDTISPVINDEAIKAAILGCFRNTAWIGMNGQDYYDELERSLYLNLVSITAVFTQGNNIIYDIDSLDTLRQYLTVTGVYSDYSTDTMINYTLSGNLTSGTSVITVNCQGKTATFNVIVTAFTYVTDGLVAYWDGINNTGNGHSSSTTSWTDIVGGYVMSEVNSGSSWNDDSLEFVGATGNIYRCDTIWSRSTKATIEFVLKPDSSATQVVGTFDRSDSVISGSSYYEVRRLILYNDNTVGFIGRSGYTYTNPASSITNIRKTVAIYDGFDLTKVLINNTVATVGTATHSFGISNKGDVYIGANNTTQTNYTYDGKVYAIRVYNRELTDAEIDVNFRYDNYRFSLGL